MASQSTGEFMDLLDDATYLYKMVVSFALMLIWFVMTAGPYMAYATVRDTVFRGASGNRMWLVEQNPAIALGRVNPPFPMTDGHGKGAPTQHFYAEVGSVREAEQWLLDHGYSKVDITTERLVADGRSNVKTFPIRHVEHTQIYSIVALMIDYGDGKVHLVPYSFAHGDSVIDFSKFEEETFAATYGRDNTALPRLPWLSSDGSRNHLQPNRLSESYINQYIERRLAPPEAPNLIDL